MDREDFMDIVYSELESDSDNNRANRIIDAADEYVEITQFGTKLAEVGTDCISRRQAIDAVTDELDMIDHVPQWVFDRLEGRLKQLPPAQPEQHLDEWCTDCKEYDTERHCCPRWNRVIRQTLADAQPQCTGKWIIDDDTEKFMMHCSECGKFQDSRYDRRFLFCPHCGAKMRGALWK